MKRIFMMLILACVLMPLFTVSVSAQSMEEVFNEQLEASGAAELYDLLPHETQELLSKLGIDSLSLEAFADMQPQTVLSALWDLVAQEGTAPFEAVPLMIGVLLLLGLISTVAPHGECHGSLFRAVGALAAMTPLLVPLWQTVQRVQAAADSASVFSLGFAPVYAATLAAGGYSLSAVSYQTVMLAAAEGIALLVSAAVMPLISVSLALGVAGAIDPARRIGEAGTLVNKTAVWLLTISLTVFVGILSLQGVLSASADSVGGRVLRFSVAGLVPIVGGSLSEALYTVSGCLSALRGTVGGFGVLCTVLIALPTLIECAAWSFLLFFAKLAAGLFSLSDIEQVVQIAQGIMKTLIAVLSSSALLMIISVTVVTLVGGGKA